MLLNRIVHRYYPFHSSPEIICVFHAVVFGVFWGVFCFVVVVVVVVCVCVLFFFLMGFSFRVCFL